MNDELKTIFKIRIVSNKASGPVVEVCGAFLRNERSIAALMLQFLYWI